MKSLPLIALIALALPAAADAQGWRSGKTIAITMAEDGFVPGRITLRAGQHYTLRFRNTSGKGHNFTAREFWKIARVSPADQSWVADNQLSLDAGQVATVHIVAPTTPGAQYTYRSTVLADASGHFKGEIYVR